MAALGDAEDRSVKTFFVRKKPKDHGTQDLVEGLGPGESLEGRRVVIADDVATTAGSIIKALEAAKATGALVTSALVLVDREEGGAEALAEHGVRLLSVFKGRQFLI
jgi:orotate phosphoribosyltransferase